MKLYVGRFFVIFCNVIQNGNNMGSWRGNVYHLLWRFLSWKLYQVIRKIYLYFIKKIQFYHPSPRKVIRSWPWTLLLFFHRNSLPTNKRFLHFYIQTPISFFQLPLNYNIFSDSTKDTYGAWKRSTFVQFGYNALVLILMVLMFLLLNKIRPVGRREARFIF